jgi:mRNA-degrading endonuclease RelE of RelBE toxin-antitoxin system
MRWKTVWSSEAVDDVIEIAARDLKLARRLVAAVRGFGTGERVDMRKLAGTESAWRVRVGEWRVILITRGADAIVDTVDNRRDAY